MTFSLLLPYCSASFLYASMLCVSGVILAAESLLCLRAERPA